MPVATGRCAKQALPYGVPVTNEGLPRSAQLDVLFTGYADDRVAGTVSLIREGDRVIVVDPGMVPSRAAILDPLAALGLGPADVTDVVLSHHHPDHTVNIALFGEVPVHDFQAVYTKDVWEDRPADGVHLAPSVRLFATPGHTPQDLSVLVGTDRSRRRAHPPVVGRRTARSTTRYAPDPALLRAHRDRVLALVDLVVPGHGAPFTPDSETPR